MRSEPILVEEPHASFLIQSMGLSKKEIIIQPGKPRIGNIIKKMVDKNLINFNFVLVDENTNKNSHSVFNRFTTIKYYNNYGIIIQKYSNIFLILFENKLSQWLLKTARDCNINLINIGLLNNVKGLDKDLKGIVLNPRFKNLLEEMIAKKCKAYVFLCELLKNRNDIENFIKIH